MELIPERWTFKRRTLLPVMVEVKGECIMKEAEPCLIDTALKIIDQAYSFNGYICDYVAMDKSDCPVAVFFTLIFLNEADFDRFVQSIQQK